MIKRQAYLDKIIPFIAGNSIARYWFPVNRS